MGVPDIDVHALSPEERVPLIGTLWDSLPEHQPTLTPGQEAELDRRLEALDADIASATSLDTPWHAIRTRLAQRPNEA